MHPTSTGQSAVNQNLSLCLSPSFLNRTCTHGHTKLTPEAASVGLQGKPKTHRNRHFVFKEDSESSQPVTSKLTSCINDPRLSRLFWIDLRQDEFTSQGTKNIVAWARSKLIRNRSSQDVADTPSSILCQLATTSYNCEQTTLIYPAARRQLQKRHWLQPASKVAYYNLSGVQDTVSGLRLPCHALL